ncbi:hypothetical protein GCM10027299_23890 [Larkinella ripae]
MHRLYGYAALLFGVSGVFYLASGIIKLRFRLQAIDSEELGNRLRDQVRQELTIWLGIDGLLSGWLGVLTHGVLRKNSSIVIMDASAGVVGICLLTAVLIPLGGFWLLLLQRFSRIADGLFRPKHP